MRYAYKNNRCYFSYDKNKPCEYYQQIIKIPSIAQFYIHFNVDKAVDVAQNYDYQRLNARRLVYNNVEYEVQNDIKKYHFSCETPIIVIDFPCRLQSEKMVIDGNHRMTSKVIKNQDVNYVKLSIPDTVSLITQTFEKAWYLFAVELNAAIQLKTYNQRKNFLEHQSICKDFLMYMKNSD